jgi:hypothetical protein
MQILARVLFEVNARDPDTLDIPVHDDLNMPALADRQLVLGYLVAFGKVGIIIVFTREPAVGLIVQCVAIPV